jgi:hypothetical protein
MSYVKGRTISLNVKELELKINGATNNLLPLDYTMRVIKAENEMELFHKTFNCMLSDYYKFPPLLNNKITLSFLVWEQIYSYRNSDIVDKFYKLWLTLNGTYQTSPEPYQKEVLTFKKIYENISIKKKYAIYFRESGQGVCVEKISKYTWRQGFFPLKLSEGQVLYCVTTPLEIYDLFVIDTSSTTTKAIPSKEYSKYLVEKFIKEVLKGDE